MSGTLRFPPTMDPEARDLIEWLLSKDPTHRPSEFTEIKTHGFFSNIHWGRITKKEAIPPWVPDLYKFHGPKLTSLNQVFHKNTYYKECNRISHNYRKKSGENFKGSIYVHDQNSNRQPVKVTDRIDDSTEGILYLDGKCYCKLQQILPNINQLSEFF